MTDCKIWTDTDANIPHQKRKMVSVAGGEGIGRDEEEGDSGGWKGEKEIRCVRERGDGG